jgi:hypothetical protein
LKVRFLLLSSLAVVISATEPSSSPADAIVENYRAATQRQEQVVKGASMEVEIAGAIPKLKKQGRLHALRHITALGRITYEALLFQGDDTVKKQVIAKYLQAEQDSQEDPTIAVTPDNYKFKFKGRSELDGRDIYTFQVTPKKKRDKLYKGEICVDAATYLRVQESGYLVKNPSLVIRKVHFVRKYDIRDGISVPRQLQSQMDTWVVGRVELTVDYSNFSIDGAKRGAAAEANEQ